MKPSLHSPTNTKTMNDHTTSHSSNNNSSNNNGNDDDFFFVELTDQDLQQILIYVEGRNPRRLNALLRCRQQSRHQQQQQNQNQNQKRSVSQNATNRNRSSFSTAILQESTPKSSDLLNFCLHQLKKARRRRRRNRCSSSDSSRIHSSELTSELTNNDDEDNHSDDDGPTATTTTTTKRTDTNSQPLLSPSSGSSSLSALSLLRATLMINPLYETPWKLLEQSSSILLSLPPLLQLECISSIQSFLTSCTDYFDIDVDLQDHRLVQQQQQQQRQPAESSNGQYGSSSSETSGREANQSNDVPTRGSVAYFLSNFVERLMDDLLSSFTSSSSSSSGPEKSAISSHPIDGRLRESATHTHEEDDNEYDTSTMESYVLLYSGLFTSVCAVASQFWKTSNSSNIKDDNASKTASMEYDHFIRATYVLRSLSQMNTTRTHPRRFTMWLMLVKEAAATTFVFSQQHKLELSEIMLDCFLSWKSKSKNKENSPRRHQQHHQQQDRDHLSPSEAAAIIPILLELLQLWTLAMTSQWQQKQEHDDEIDDESVPVGDETNKISRNLIRAVVLATELTSMDRKMYDSAEHHIQSFASNLFDSNDSMYKCWKSVLLDNVTVAQNQYNAESDFSNNIPHWLVINLFMALSNQSNTRQMDRGANASGIQEDCHQNGDREDDNTKRIEEIFSVVWDCCQDRGSLCDVSTINLQYSSNGSFLDAEGNTDDMVSSLGNIIIRCILAGGFDRRVMQQKPELSQLDHGFHRRGLYFLDAAERIIFTHRNLEDGQTVPAVAVYAVVSTILFLDCPSSRSEIIHRIRWHLAVKRQCFRLYNCALKALRMITQSLTNYEGQDACQDLGRSSYEEYLSVFLDGTLPACVLPDLSNVFQGTREARPDILWWSNRLLSVALSESYSGRKYQVSRSSSVRDEIRFGLKSCLMLICDENWDEVAERAWKTIADLLATNKSPLDLETMEWIDVSIEDMFLSTERTYRKPLYHILRLLTVRLSLYLDSNGIMKLETGKMNADVKNDMHNSCGFVRLTLLLIQLFSSLSIRDDEGENRALLLAEGREVFLRHALLIKNGESDSFRHLKKFLKHRQPFEDDDAFSACWYVFLLIQCCSLNSFVSPLRESESIPSELQSSLLKDLRCRVQAIKVFELATINAAVYESIPFWPSSNVDDSRVKKVDPQNAATGAPLDVKLSILESLVEFLWISPLPTRTSNVDRIDPLSRRIVPACGFLITNRKRVVESLSASDTAYSSAALIRIAGPFLGLCSEVLHDAIHQSYILSEFHELVSSATAFCDILFDEYSARSDLKQDEVISYLWSLYQAIASEESAVRLIDYLESREAEGDDARITPSTYGFQILSDGEDVDFIVQHIRLSVLRALNVVLDNVSRQVEMRTESKVHEFDLSHNLVWSMLWALTKDLKLGLAGHSGAITREMYMAFVLSIESCSTILQHCDSVATSIDMDILARASSVLSDILVSFSLNEARLFKSTLIVATSVFPLLWISLMRRSLRSNGLLAEHSCHKILVGVRLMSSTLDDATAILHRWYAIREPDLVPWEDIAGPFHLRPDIDLSNNELDGGQASNLISFDDSATSLFREVPRVVHIPSPKRNKKQKSQNSVVEELDRIRFNSKETWSFAMSCSFIAIEREWQEALLAMESEDLDKGGESKSDDGTCSSHVSNFFEQRTSELSNLLSQVNRFFQPLLASSDSTMKGASSCHPLGILAMGMPSAPRSRLCVCVEKISQALICAVGCLYSFLSGDWNEKTHRLVLLEATSCLAAWLKNWDEEEDSNPGSDFSVGVVRWHSGLSRKLPPESTPSQMRKQSELLSRVTISLEQVRSMYQHLIKLQAKLQRCVVNKKRDKRFVQLSVLAEIAGLKPSDENDNSGRELLRMIERKVTNLKMLVPGQMDQLPLPDFPGGRSENRQSGGPKQLSRNSKARQHVGETRKRKRNNSSRHTPRTLQGGNIVGGGPSSAVWGNRNRVVGMFFDLDEKQEGKKNKNKKRRPRNNDAYADLEDFLVEG